MVSTLTRRLMMKRIVWWGVFAAITLLISGPIGITLAQNKAIQDQSVAGEPEMQWLWGEVISADTQKNELKVKYLDYEADLEKEILMIADEKTVFENAKSLGEIKPQDTVSVDYIVGSEGKNIAKNISVEKPEMQESPVEPVVPEAGVLPLEEKAPAPAGQ